MDDLAPYVQMQRKHCPRTNSMLRHDGSHWIGGFDCMVITKIWGNVMQAHERDYLCRYDVSLRKNGRVRRRVQEMYSHWCCAVKFFILDCMKRPNTEMCVWEYIWLRGGQRSVHCIHPLEDACAVWDSVVILWDSGEIFDKNEFSTLLSAWNYP